MLSIAFFIRPSARFFCSVTVVAHFALIRYRCPSTFAIAIPSEAAFSFTLKSSIKKYNQTLILITHDGSIASQADRICRITDGVLSE